MPHAGNAAQAATRATVAFDPVRAGGATADARELTVALRSISDGKVHAIAPGGPVLHPEGARRRRLNPATLVAALGSRDRLVVAGLTAGWVFSVGFFWAWWLSPSHRISVFGLVANSLLLCYVTVIPALFVASANLMRRVGPAVRVPALRVAFVVTKAPSESWEIVRSTLGAMLAQRFPYDYDVWLCDEKPSQQTVAWCRDRGVMVSTRYRVDSYHRDAWPRRTRCKEGNLAYFYDHWGYANYDVVAQLDCDHRPSPSYLAEMVRPFTDPAVGYVAAPSICDANAASSWSARGRAYREASLHGPFQLGHSDGLGPLCIGSHYAVRTAALRDIGGIGPELAEDFSTTFLLNAAGWQGVFAIDAEAHGDGPETFSAMAVQEFQWSRSLTMILLGLLPGNIARLPWLLRLRFTYPLVYYLLVASTTLAGLALVVTAAINGTPWVNVNYLSFLLHWWPIPVWTLLMAILMRRRGLLRPAGAPVVSWEIWLYTLARWPYVAWGICAALVQRVRRSARPITFAVTPKRTQGTQTLTVRSILPYLVISVITAGAAVLGERFTDAAGYVFLCLLAAVTYAAVTIGVPLLHAAEARGPAGLRFLSALRRSALAPLAVGAIAPVAAILSVATFPAYAAPLLSG